MPKVNPMKSKDEPNMSDKTLLLSVEDLINVAFGSRQDNKIDMKTIQTVLHILARQMRLLEQLVEIRLDDLEELEEQGALIPDSGTTKYTAGSLSKKNTDKGSVKHKDGGEVGKRETPGSKDQKGSRDDKPVTDKAVTDKYKGKVRGDIGSLDRETNRSSDKRLGKSRVSYLDMSQSQDQEADDMGKDFERSEQDIFIDDPDGGTLDENRLRGSRKQRKGERSITEIQPYDGSSKPGSTRPRVSISERQDGVDKILVVDKDRLGISARTASKTGIEVITRSQFKLLEVAVKQLRNVAAPLEPLTLPDNDQLVGELLKGTASLTNTMAAMQVNARVEAAEKAVSRMAGILTRLAAMGTVPPELAKHLPDEKTLSILGGDLPDPQRLISMGGVSMAPSTTMSSVPLGPDTTITHEEMEVGFLAAREDIMKNMTHMIAKAIQNSDNAVYIARSASDKIEVAMNLNKRLNSLYSMVADYSEQLSGFDEGISTQMQGFQEQIAQMRFDLKLGLEQLEAINTNAESAAIVELTERYEVLMQDLERGLNKHQTLIVSQERLGEELKNLIVCLEILRDQKADRDEVWDGLKDKASISRLAGMLSQSVFERARQDIEGRLDQCHTKFQKQDQTWTQALAEINAELEEKADLTVLLADREQMQRELQKLLEKAQDMEERLGEPMAAVITRELSRGARCGGCMAPALMPPNDIASNMPMQLPAFKHEKIEEVCLTTALPPERHACNRWVGGSHTLLSEAVSRERTTQKLAATAPPTKRYLGYGDDGRLYKMAEECLPCVECPRPKEVPAPQPPKIEPKVIKPWHKPQVGAQIPKIILNTKRAKSELMKKLDAMKDEKKAEQSDKLEVSQPEHGGGDNGVAEPIREETEPQKGEIKQQTEQQPLEMEEQQLETDQKQLKTEQQQLEMEKQPLGTEQQPLETVQNQLETEQKVIETNQKQVKTENIPLETQVVGSQQSQSKLMEQPQPNQQELQEGMEPMTVQPEEEENIEVIKL